MVEQMKKTPTQRGRPRLPDDEKKQPVGLKISPESAELLRNLPWGQSSPLVDHLLTQHRILLEQSEGKPSGTLEILSVYNAASDAIQTLQARRDLGEGLSGAERELLEWLEEAWGRLREIPLFYEPEGVFTKK